MSGPLVSIIIPCYGQAHLLPQALDSALGQSHAPVQVVLVNDGSPDDTDAVAARYAARVTYVRKTNGGLPSARNAGIRAAEGTYLHFLDADDLIHPDAVSWLVQAMDGREDRVCLMGHQFFERSPGEDGQPPGFPPQTSSLFPWLIHANYPVHAYLASRRMVVAAGGFEESLKSCEDWDLWLRLALAGADLATVPAVGAYYRRHPGTMSTDPHRMLLNRTEVLLRFHDRAVRDPAIVRAIGRDLLEAECRIRDRFRARKLRLPQARRLTGTIRELRRLGAEPRQSWKMRVLRTVLGEWAADWVRFVWWSIRYPEPLHYYKTEWW